MSTEKVSVAKSDEVVEGQLHAVTADGRAALLTRYQGRVVAFANSCPHLGLSMARGKLVGQVLRCPWHGSRFDICSGENLDWVNAFMGVPMPGWTHKVFAMGKSPAPLETLETEERDGEVFISPPTTGKKRS